MKGRIAAIIAFLLFYIAFCTSGLFEGIVNFLTWLVDLEYDAKQHINSGRNFC